MACPVFAPMPIGRSLFMSSNSKLLEKLNYFAVAGESTDWQTIALKATVAISLAILAFYLIRTILGYLERRRKDAGEHPYHHQLHKAFRKTIYNLLFFVLGLYLLQMVGNLFLEKLFLSVFIILFAFPVHQFLRALLDYLEENVAEKTANTVDNILFDLLNKFSGFIIFGIGVVLALDLIGINVMPIIAGAGVFGLAVGFAAKDTLSNLIAGILLIIDRPFEVGDRIEVWSAPAGNATWGDVIDIGLRATRIKTTDNIIIVIPNNEIMKRDIVNYTILSKSIRVRINVGVGYNTDIEKAKQVLLDVAAEIDWVQKYPAPKVVVRNFGESSVDLQLRVWIANARRRMDTISYVIDRAKQAFDENGIEIPFPKRDLYIVDRRESD